MNLKVADEAWIATALLHREHPHEDDFRLSEIIERARREFRDIRPGVRAHIVSHCVASNPPSPVNYRMLHETGRGKRRLFRPGDPVHPNRTGKMYPDTRDVPPKYHELIDWYVKNYSHQDNPPVAGSTKPAAFLKFVGAISAFDLQRMSDAIRNGCERVDSSEW
jgi:hypothetical protein